MHSAAQIIIVLISVIWCYADILDKLQVCKRSDPNINDCLKLAIQNALPNLKNGFPEYNFPSMDPMKIPVWDIEPTPPLHFTKEYRNIEMYNHAEAEIKEVSSTINDQEFVLKIKAFCPLIKFFSDYAFIDSEFAGVDVSGNGKASYVHTGYHLMMTMKGEINKRDNDDYLTVTDVEVKMEADKFVVDYKSDNEERDELINTFAHHHGLFIFPLVKHDYEVIYAEAYKELANAIFSVVPFNKVFPK